MLSWNIIHISNLKINTVVLIVYTLNKLADTLTNNDSHRRSNVFKSGGGYL